MISKRIRTILLFGNLAVFVAAAGVLTRAREIHRSEGRSILLAIEQYDPRSLIQGDYLALRYEIAGEIERKFVSEGSPNDGLVVLGVDTDDVGTLRRAFDGAPLAPDEHLLYYRVRGGRADRVRVAAEQFRFQEGKAADYARARYAEVRVTEDGRTLLTSLRDADREVIGRAQN